MTVLEMIQILEGKKDSLLEDLLSDGQGSLKYIETLPELKKVLFVLSYLKSQLEGHELEIMEVIDIE